MSEGNGKSLEYIEALTHDWQFFQEFSKEEIRETILLMSLHLVRKNETVFREDESGDYLFFIMEGRVEISLSSKTRTKIIAILETGSVVGEMTMLDEHVRSAGAKAIEDTEILILTRDKLNMLLHSNPFLAAKIFKQLGRIVASRLRRMMGNFAEIS